MALRTAAPGAKALLVRADTATDSAKKIKPFFIIMLLGLLLSS